MTGHPENGEPGPEDVMLAAVAVVRAQAELGRRPSREAQDVALMSALAPFLEHTGSQLGPALAADLPVLALITQLAAMAGGGFMAAAAAMTGLPVSEEALLDRLDDLEQAILIWCQDGT